jgi:hypothetical protein
LLFLTAYVYFYKYLKYEGQLEFLAHGKSEDFVVSSIPCAFAETTPVVHVKYIISVIETGN